MKYILIATIFSFGPFGSTNIEQVTTAEFDSYSACREAAEYFDHIDKLADTATFSSCQLKGN